MSTTIQESVLASVREAMADVERALRTLKQAERELAGDRFNASPRPNGNGPAPTNGILCKCGESAVLKTLKSKKTGNDYQVYTCAKPKGQDCDLFQFPDR